MKPRGQAMLLLTAALLFSTAKWAWARPNEFPVRSSTEVFLGEAEQVYLEFPFYFPVDFTRYRPVDRELARMLSLPPMVEAPDGLQVRVTEVECSRELLQVTVDGQLARVEGGRMAVDLLLLPDEALLPGERSVTLRFPQIDYVFEALGTSPNPGPARVELDLVVWPSRQAKLEAQRREVEERRRRQRAALWHATKLSLLTLLGLSVVWVPYRWLRPWIRPSARVEVAQGGHVQVSRALPARRRDRHQDAGTILRTLWAHDVLGSRQRIKVETLKREPAGVPGGRVDLLVSVGESVRLGTYGTRGPIGAVRVRIVPKR